MKTNPLLILAALGLFQTFAADQTIKFSNSPADGAVHGLVTFDSTFAALAGQGVRNGVLDGASFVAQLFRLRPDGTEVPLGAPASFHDANTPIPGTWAGDTRIAEGVPLGTPMILQVKVWDSSFPSFEDACRASLAGKSAFFAFQDALSNPTAATDNALVNFQGFSIGMGCVPEPTTLVLGALGCAFVLWLPCNRDRW